MQCPKCGHVRAINADNPEWQCPACGIAYNKYRPVDRAKELVRPLTADDTTPAVAADGSVWILIVANLIALVTALLLGWNMSELMIIYWAQSLIIGASYFARIISLDKFSTENFKINNRSVEPTESTKRQTAGFFCLHYGFFHVVYLMFMLDAAPGGQFINLGVLICVAVFGFNHYFSYRYHRDLDRQGTPNIGTLMFTPYLRIVPMHLIIIFGQNYTSATELLLFGLLKMISDVVMHVVEHRRIGYRQ